MKRLARFETHHGDYIHDVEYDYFGRRMATCSSDQKIKVWDLDRNGEWRCTAEIKAHTASIHRVCWAHPEFGQILASCSSDQRVNVYEEKEEVGSGRRNWVSHSLFAAQTRTAVSAVEFGPKHMGLVLGACGLDGHLRIYHFEDPTNLENSKPVSIAVDSKGGCSCLSWNPFPFDPPMVAVGVRSTVKVFEKSEVTQEFKEWHQVAELTGHRGVVHDVAWAPNMGRSYHIIATACKDGIVRIWKLRAREASTGREGAYKVETIAELGQHQAEVWRVAWNATGSVLASAGDDGTVRLWKADFKGAWVSSLVLTRSEENASLGPTTQTALHGTRPSVAVPRPAVRVPPQRASHENKFQPQTTFVPLHAMQHPSPPSASTAFRFAPQAQPPVNAAFNPKSFNAFEAKME